jgi:hypothetical protein
MASWSFFCAFVKEAAFGFSAFLWSPHVGSFVGAWSGASCEL